MRSRGSVLSPLMAGLLSISLLTASAGAFAGSVRRGNAVEPLSNGLLLTMTRNDIRQKFGDPAPGWDSCMMSYSSFVVVCGGRGQGIWHFTINAPGVTLNSGIGVGSTRTEVARVFSNPYGMTLGQYKLDFSYDGDRVSKIKIDPADGEFKPFAASSGSASPQQKADAPAGGGKGAFVGTWYGTARTVGTIVIKANGTYDYNGSPGGRWRASGDQIVFDGNLKPWDGGRATLKNGSLEFYWTTASGAHQWFSFAK